MSRKFTTHHPYHPYHPYFRFNYSAIQVGIVARELDSGLVRNFIVGYKTAAFGVDNDTIYGIGNTNTVYGHTAPVIYKIKGSVLSTPFPVPGGFQFLADIVVGANHRIYVSDLNGTRIPWLTDKKTQNPVVAAIRVPAPNGMDIDSNRGLVYVANVVCNTLSEINATTNKLNSAVTFVSDPPTSGTISCRGEQSPEPWHAFKNNDYLRIDDGRTLVCKTDVNWLGNGLYPLKFDKWSGSLVNSTTTPLRLPISGSGTLTAHFTEIVPHDIINGVIVAGFVALGGLSLRAFAIRRREKLQERWLEIINSEYNRLSNNREECLQRLAEIREDVMHMYADGTIPKHYFDKLNKQISTYEERFFKRTPT